MYLSNDKFFISKKFYSCSKRVSVIGISRYNPLMTAFVQIDYSITQSLTGIVKQNVEPLPGPSDSTQTLPP